MATKTIAWNSGTGNITLTYGGQGNGTILVSSDPNSLYTSRSKTITVKTGDGSITRTITVVQAAKVRTDITNAVVTASNQTYSGSALTPTPTVTLNGSTIPSSGYDVTYSNNTNAGTATITVTGKGDYTGTASGTFTIAKANRTVSFSSPTTSVDVGSTVTNAAIISAGASDGTLTYSSSNTSYATVSSSGVVTGVAAGSVTITASITGGTNYNDASGSYSMSVEVPLAEGAYIERYDGNIYTSSEWNSSWTYNADDNLKPMSIVVVYKYDTTTYMRRIFIRTNKYSLVNFSSGRLYSSNPGSIPTTGNKDWDGRANTEILKTVSGFVHNNKRIYDSNNQHYYLAYLPARLELRTMLNKRTEINACLTAIGMNSLPNDSGSNLIWTSTYYGQNPYVYLSNNRGGHVYSNSYYSVLVTEYPGTLISI